MTEQDSNPFASPEASLEAPASLSPEGVSQEIVDELAGSRGWAQFLAVLGFIAVGLLVLGAVGFLVAVGQMGGMVEVGIVAVVFLGLAGLLVVPTLHLQRFATSCSRTMSAPTEGHLTVTVEHQRKFWSWTTVLMVLSAILTFVGIFVSEF